MVWYGMNGEWRYILLCWEKSVNPLLDGTSLAKWEPEKKDPLHRSFFSYRPSAGAAPRSVPTQQTVYVVAPTLQLLTISLAKPFVSNTTQFSLFIQTPLQLTGQAWPACRAILTLQLLTISNYLASPSRRPALPALANLASLGSHSHTVSYRYRYRMTYTLMRLDIRARGYHMTWHMAVHASV